MSRKSSADREAKKARRRKRQAARSVGRMPAGPDDAYSEIADAVTEINAWLVGRGWVLDEENATDDLVSWVYPPSAADADGDREPVTRIWIALQEDDEQVVLEMGTVLVGAGGDDGASLIAPESLAEQIEVLEAFRIDDPRPDLG